MAADTGAYEEITTEGELRELLGEPTAVALGKERRTLHEHHVEWLARSPLCLISTSAADGSCDVSPKGDPAGFAKVLDDTTLVIPDRPGNRRADSYRNILTNPHVGLLFLIPGRGDSLRINGRARLLRDAPFFDDLTVKGHRPALALLVEVEQAYFHCSRAFVRSALWKPETWNPEAAPSRARISKSLERTHESLEELERYYGPSYDEKDMYA
ncbi:pyridoxamine 5'-phosphate oxidase family protein [Streptomyces sp. NBC_01264]|uniref:pyridoxamine 5'-phosphate oxidase family protein n=1 Tax=Streptomyces sp. NBC_01264 TaxID=2903804 RepID=UPI00225C2E4C|nr:pyridoxamine 5'-phosphate oxidase family protein [Streptomyces sp. NBC_01264]MCX4782445.1 pyridoxamine 5'-phosphate oxidase family protein [Streptomyces sp. NBC_01264]